MNGIRLLTGSCSHWERQDSDTPVTQWDVQGDEDKYNFYKMFDQRDNNVSWDIIGCDESNTCSNDSTNTVTISSNSVVSVVSLVIQNNSIAQVIHEENTNLKLSVESWSRSLLSYYYIPPIAVSLWYGIIIQFNSFSLLEYLPTAKELWQANINKIYIIPNQTEIETKLDSRDESKHCLISRNCPQRKSFFCWRCQKICMCHLQQWRT